MNDKIQERIRKLLALAASGSGATEDEADTAMQMAAAMAARYGIELEALNKDKAAPKVTLKSHRKEWKVHQAYAANAAAVLVGIECNVYDLGKRGFSFVGREELIETAEELMFWLFRQIEDLYKSNLPKGLTQGERAEFRKTFKAACALRVLERAKRYMRELKTSDAQAQDATGQNALVVLNYFETLSKEVDEFWNNRFRASEERAEQYKLEQANKRQLMLDAMTDAERQEFLDKEEKQAEKDRKAQEREDARRAKLKGRRGPSMPIGSGTNVGYAAGDRVQLRRQVQ